jgi:PAS domain S-box-containing protein
MMIDTIVLIIVGFVLSVAGFSIALRGARTKSALYKAAINVVRDGVVIINRNGRIVDLNYSAQRVIGHPDIVGKSLEAIRPEWSDLVSQEQREAGEEVVVENGNRKRTYNFNTYSLEDTRTHDGNRIVIMSDLTDAFVVLV